MIKKIYEWIIRRFKIYVVVYTNPHRAGFSKHTVDSLWWSQKLAERRVEFIKQNYSDERVHFFVTHINKSIIY